MSVKSDKAIRRAALKYARREDRKIAQAQMDYIYSLPLRYRLIYAIGVVLKWGRRKGIMSS